jgi:hypothetical protein
MKKLGMVLSALAAATGSALAQTDTVTQAERSHASLMILLVVVGGALVTYLLMWVLRRTGKLPEEKPMPKARWTHPEDKDGA